MNAKLNEYRLDGGYDSFENHADIWYKLKAKPLISLPIDAVINEEGELHRIDHWANKMWKLGGSRHMKIDEKLRFLYENGRQEQVGMYLRNQNLKDKTFPDSCKLRQECERIHGHIKSTVKFDVRRIQVVPILFSQSELQQPFWTIYVWRDILSDSFMGLKPCMYFIYLWDVMDNTSIYNKREKCLKSIAACLKS